jgi:hypothetical protein
MIKCLTCKYKLSPVQICKHRYRIISLGCKSKTCDLSSWTYEIAICNTESTMSWHWHFDHHFPKAPLEWYANILVSFAVEWFNSETIQISDMKLSNENKLPRILQICDQNTVILKSLQWTGYRSKYEYCNWLTVYETYRTIHFHFCRQPPEQPKNP